VDNSGDLTWTEFDNAAKKRLAGEGTVDDDGEAGRSEVAVAAHFAGSSFLPGSFMPPGGAQGGGGGGVEAGPPLEKNGNGVVVAGVGVVVAEPVVPDKMTKKEKKEEKKKSKQDKKGKDKETKDVKDAEDARTDEKTDEKAAGAQLVAVEETKEVAIDEVKVSVGRSKGSNDALLARLQR
jgi:hypothetical protein